MFNPSNEVREGFDAPCCFCKWNVVDYDMYPCSGCKHNASYNIKGNHFQFIDSIQEYIGQEGDVIMNLIGETKDKRKGE